MNISLNPQLEKMIQDRVAGGRYNSASEVVREGLRLLEQRDQVHEAKLRELRQAIQKGADDMEAGRLRDGRDVFADLAERGRLALKGK